MRAVHKRQLNRIESIVLHVADHADNGVPGCGVAIEGERARWRLHLLANRILPGEKLPCERFVNHRHVLRLLVVGFGEGPPSENWNAENVKIIRRYEGPAGLAEFTEIP